MYGYCIFWSSESYDIKANYSEENTEISSELKKQIHTYLNDHYFLYISHIYIFFFIFKSNPILQFKVPLAGQLVLVYLSFTKFVNFEKVVAGILNQQMGTWFVI